MIETDFKKSSGLAWQDLSDEPGKSWCIYSLGAALGGSLGKLRQRMKLVIVRVLLYDCEYL